MLKRLGMILVLAVMVGFGSAPRYAAAKAQKPKTDEMKNQCVECHKNDKVKKNEYVSHSFADWAQSPHGKSGVTCEACHGGQPTETDAAKAHLGVLRSTQSDSPVFYKNLPETCGKCHTDEKTAFLQSKHYQRLERTGKGPTCTTCHGVMKGTILTSKDLDQTCNLCHSKPAGAQDTLLLMSQSKELLEIADETVASLKAQGKTVGNLEKELAAGHESLNKAEHEWHTFDLKRVKRLAQEVFVHSREVRNQAKSVEKDKAQ